MIAQGVELNRAEVRRRVLVVEDAEDCSATLEIALHSIRGLEVLFASTAEEALRTLAKEKISNSILCRRGQSVKRFFSTKK